MRARQGPRWSRSEPNAPSARPLSPRPAPLRTASRAQGGTGDREQSPALRGRGALTGRSVGLQPVAGGAGARAGSGRAFGVREVPSGMGGCASTRRTLGGDAGKPAQGQHRCCPGLGRGSQRPALSVFTPPLGALDAGPGVGRAAPQPRHGCGKPQTLLVSLRQRPQGHPDWMSERFCPRLGRLKPLDKRVIDRTFRLYRGSSQPSYGSLRSGPAI